MNVKSKSRTIHGLLANRSISESDQRRALMMPQELMQMPKGDLLLMRGGIPPVRGRKIEYFRSKRFTSRISDPPKVAPRPITISAAPVTAKLAGEASSSDPLAQALSAKKAALLRSEEHTSELQSLMRISYAVFCLKNKTLQYPYNITTQLN